MQVTLNFVTQSTIWIFRFFHLCKFDSVGRTWRRALPQQRNNDWESETVILFHKIIFASEMFSVMIFETTPWSSSEWKCSFACCICWSFSCFNAFAQESFSTIILSIAVCLWFVTDCILEIDNWMSSNRLKLNSDKTQFSWLGTRQQLSKTNAHTVNIGSSTIQLQANVNNLGFIIDEQFHNEGACAKNLLFSLLSTATTPSRP